MLAWTFIFESLRSFHDVLRLLLLDAGLDLDGLLHLGPDLLDRLRVEHPRVHAALRALRQQDVGHLLQLEIVVRIERKHQLGLLDARVRALEVETFAISLFAWSTAFFSSTVLTSEMISKEGMARDYTDSRGTRRMRHDIQRFFWNDLVSCRSADYW